MEYRKNPRFLHHASSGRAHVRQCFSVATVLRSAQEDRELIEAWRAVANAKLTEFRRQAWRLALLTNSGVVGTGTTVDRLWEIALAHALVRALGEDRVQAIISEAFAATHQRRR
jgi:hypothetical protein